MKFLIDAQLPPALAIWLREQGHDAQALREVNLQDAQDALIWAFAQRAGATILTKDEDFALRCEQLSTGPTIVWLRVGNTSNAALKAWLGPRMPGIVQLIEQGSRLVEVI